MKDMWSIYSFTHAEKDCIVIDIIKGLYAKPD